MISAFLEYPAMLLLPGLFIAGVLLIIHQLVTYKPPEPEPEPDPNALNLPSPSELLRNPARLMKLRSQVGAIGFLHRADTRAVRTRRWFSDHKGTWEKFAYSELYIIRQSDGEAETVELRQRNPLDLQDIDGEQTARKLAKALDLELQVS